MARTITIRRSELTVPGHNMHMLERAAATDADAIVADCEDACPLSAKGPPVRNTIVEAFHTLDWGGKLLSFRANNTRSPYFEGDLDHIVARAVDRFDGIVIPKVFEPAQIALVDERLTRLELASGWTRRIQIEALIETALGIENAYAIAAASPRMASLIFGIADYSADIGVSDAYTNQNIRFIYAKQRVMNAAKAAGIDAIDGVHLKIRELDELKEMSEESAGFGFDGRWAIHPSHIAIINQAYAPSAAQLEHAQNVVEAYEAADAQGLGALTDPDTGEMIDEATIKMAFKLLLKGVKAGTADAALLQKAVRNAAYSGYDFLGTSVGLGER